MVPTGWVFMKFGYLSIFLKPVEEIQGSVRSDKNKGYFIKRPIHIFIVSRSVILRMRNVSQRVAEKMKTHILCTITFFRKS